jgi:NAD(P)-dependent dehydrogenase (short-subunit alcohol dehydrogenase family)
MTGRTTAVVTGASRGFGRGIALALTEADVEVIGVARTASALHDLQARIGERFTPVVGDATDGDLAAEVLERRSPGIVVLNAGASPAMAPIHEQSWESFSRTWETDTRHVFEWIRAALRLPLAPGSLVITMSSGAALRGSPLSGGYAGAKSALRFISSYAAAESDRAGLGIRFVTLLPQLTPATDLGSVGVAAYAERQGVDTSTFARNLQPILTPEKMGAAVLELVRDPGTDHRELMITGAGLRPVPSGG